MTHRRRHICDVAGCGNVRERWQRICSRCYNALWKHKDVRTGIIEAYRFGNRPRHRKLAKTAGTLIGLTAPAPDAIPASAAPTSWQDRADLA